MAERFAEMLATKNKAYDTLVRQARDVAAEAHTERLRLKSDADRQRCRIQDLLVQYTLT